MSISSRYSEVYTKPATGVTRRKEIDLTNLVNTEQTITAATAINVDANYVGITGPATGTYAVTLGTPNREGQILVIEMISTTSTNAVTLALTNVVGGSAASSASFNAANETLTLVSISNKWVVLDEHGVTLS